jgi:hypothetical protein
MLNNSFKPVPTTLLQQLATQSAITPATVTTQPAASAVHLSPHNAVTSGVNSAANSQQWLDDWCSQYAPEVSFRPWQGGGRIAIVECLTNPDHKGKAYITQQTNGAISAGCQHASCTWDWAQYRAARQPNLPQKPSVAVLPVAAKTTASWTVPTPLTYSVAPQLPILDAKALIPDYLLPYCQDIAHRMQAAIEFVITSLLISFGALLGNKFLIYPKHNDPWKLAPVIWGIVVGEPGTAKTPVITETTKSVMFIENNLSSQYESALKLHSFNVKQFERQIKQLKSKKSAATQQQIDALEIQLETLKAQPPVEERIVIKDVTVEKLQELLSVNQNGLFYLADELVNLFITMYKQGHENDRGFFLEAWNGLNSYTIDRIGRGTVKIPKTCVSVLGTIQPDVLDKHIQTSIKLRGSDGFFARFQLVIYPPKSTEWHCVDEAPDAIAQQKIRTITNFLYNWTPQQDKHFHEYTKYHPGESGVRFDKAAQQIFISWYTKHMNRVRGGAISSAAMKEHLAKYDSLMAKLALIFHCSQHALNGSIPPFVDELAAARAAAWCEFLECHAEQMYSLNKVNIPDEMQAAIVILDKIAGGKFVKCNTINDIIRKNWSKCTLETVVEDAVVLLEVNGWLQVNPSPITSAGGRPTSVISLHPQIQSYLTNRADYVVEVPTIRPTPWLDRLKAMLNSSEPQATSFDNADYLAMLQLVGGVSDDNVVDSASHFNMIQLITQVHEIEEATVENFIL